MNTTKVSGYVKVAEAAEILGVSQGTVRAWAEAGKIPMHKNPANGYRLFRREDLAKFLAAIARPQKTGS
jgi:excisionase family DNA binding protein